MKVWTLAKPRAFVMGAARRQEIYGYLGFISTIASPLSHFIRSVWTVYIFVWSMTTLVVAVNAGKEKSSSE